MSGGRRRELELITRLARDLDIHLLAVSKTPDEDLANASRLRAICRRVEVFPALPPEAPNGQPEAPRQCLRHRSPQLTRRVHELAKAGWADLVHVEGFFLMQHLPMDVPAPVLLVEQNVEHDLDLQRARSGTVTDARAAALTWRAEVDAWRRAGAVAVLTDEDRALVRSAVPTAAIRVVPDGADHVPIAPRGRPEPDSRSIVFLANFGYEPNVDAAIHLCRDVLPLIERAQPDAQLWLVGNAPPPAVRELASDRVKVTGRVEDVIRYVDRAAAAVCPLRIGGGIKVKMIEALRRGKAVVSTSIGAQGLPAPAREAIAIADDAETFAAAVARLMADPGERRRAERRALAAARSLPTWDAAAAALGAVYEELAGPALAPAIEGAAG